MIVADPNDIGRVVEVLVQAAHRMTMIDGTPARMPTLDAQRLRAAAITALAVATGQAVWPGDEVIDVQAPTERRVGVMRMRG